MKVHFSPFLSLWVPYWTATCKISTPPTSIFPPFKFDRRPTIRQRRMIFCFQMSLFCQMFLVDRLVESDQAGAWRKWRLSALQCYLHLENLHPITKPPPAFLFIFPLHTRKLILCWGAVLPNQMTPSHFFISLISSRSPANGPLPISHFLNSKFHFSGCCQDIRVSQLKRTLPRKV